MADTEHNPQENSINAVAEETTAEKVADTVAVNPEENTKAAEAATTQVTAETEAAAAQVTAETETVTEQSEEPAPQQEEEEEVIFAGPDMPLPPKNDTDTSYSEASAAASGSEGIVFAKAEKSSTKSRIKVHKDRKALKGIVAALLVLCLAGGGGILAWQLSKTTSRPMRRYQRKAVPPQLFPLRRNPLRMPLTVRRVPRSR